MATGDQADFQSRLRAVLPRKWFPDTTPILDAVLAGLADNWARIYTLLQYVKLQARIATATDIWLDAIAFDFFGVSFQRSAGQRDASFRSAILARILQPKATRAALISALQALTGRTPVVFEPANATDTGGWGNLGMTAGTGLGYGVAGGYGSLQLPFQAFVTAHRPSGGGVANVVGYYNGTGWAGGGYGVGAIQYASLAMVQGQVTDAQIYATVAAVMPVATIAWTRIEA